MPGDTAKEITFLLNRASKERESYDRLAELVYDELRKMASKLMATERDGHTLQPTMIASDAYLKLIDQSSRNWQNRTQFFAVAAQQMRRILVDYGRRHQSQKRWGTERRVELKEATDIPAASFEDLLALDEALQRLEKLDPRQGQIVELKYFGDLKEDQIAAVLGISDRTVKREWAFAKTWLYAELRSRRHRPTDNGRTP